MLRDEDPFSPLINYAAVMENLPPNVPSDRSPAAVTGSDPAKKKKMNRVLLIFAAVIAVLCVAGVLFFKVPAARKVIFSAGCVAMAGRPVATEEFCHTSYKCLSTLLPAQDAGSSCGDDFDCQGVCADRKEADSASDPFGLGVCLPQFGCDPYRGECSATRSKFTYYHRHPGCGI